MATLRRTERLTSETQRTKHESQRTHEFAREDLMRAVHRDNMIVANASSDDRVMNMRRTRVMAAEQQQRQIVSSVQQEHTRRKKLAQKTAYEDAVAEELQKLRDLSLRDEKMRQQLCETEPEIRELKAKLDAGYVRKEVQAQIGEHEMETDETRRLKFETGRMLQTQRMEWEQQEVEAARSKFVQTQVYQQDLEAQLAEEEARKVAAYEQFMKDKKMIDEIVQRIHAEDASAAHDEAEKKIANRRDMDEFEEQQADYRVRTEQRLAEEDATLRRQAAEMESRAQRELQEKRLKSAARDEMQATMGADIARAEAERNEDDELRAMLSEELERERLEQEAAAEAEKKIRRRLEMLKDHDEAVFIKQMRQEVLLREEQEFRQAMLEKFARDDKLEQLSAQRRRMKGLEHGRQVENLIEERRQRIAIEREQQEAQLQVTAAQQEARRQLIEEERQKLLREHAIKLLGYLPKGVIRDAGDLDKLPATFQETYKPSKRDLY